MAMAMPLMSKKVTMPKQMKCDSDDDDEFKEQNATEDSLIGNGTIWCRNEPKIGVHLRRGLHIMRFRLGPKEKKVLQLRC